MSFNHIVSMAHGGAAMLLFSLAIISVVIAILIAVKPAVDNANERLVVKANTVGLLEIIVAGIVLVTGVVAIFLGSWPVSQLWLWMSLVIIVFYSLALVFVTKPARLAVAEGGSAIKTGLQVVLQIGHVLLLIVAYALMLLKPA